EMPVNVSRSPSWKASAAGRSRATPRWRSQRRRPMTVSGRRTTAAASSDEPITSNTVRPFERVESLKSAVDQAPREHPAYGDNLYQLFRKAGTIGRIQSVAAG